MEFQSTVWSEIDRARSGDPSGYQLFVQRYRPAVVSFLRAQGFSAEDAEDLAQEVFLCMIRCDVLSKTDPSRGRFRSLILGVTKNVIQNERRVREAVKRGRDRATVPLLEDDLPLPTQAEEEAFDRAWARQMLSAAIRELASTSPEYYQAIGLLLEGRSYAEIAAAIGKNISDVKNFIHRAKARIEECVGRMIAEYCAGDGEFGEEVDHLSRFLNHDRSV